MCWGIDVPGGVDAEGAFGAVFWYGEWWSQLGDRGVSFDGGWWGIGARHDVWLLP